MKRTQFLYLPYILKYPSCGLCGLGWENCRPRGSCCSNTTHCNCTPWLSHWKGLWIAGILFKTEEKSLWLGYTTLKLNKIPQQERNCRESTYRHVPSFLAWQLPPPCLLGETLKLVPFLVSSDSLSSARNCQRSASLQPHFYSLLSSSETLFPRGTLLRLHIQDLIETTHLRGRCYQLYFTDEYTKVLARLGTLSWGHPANKRWSLDLALSLSDSKMILKTDM